MQVTASNCKAINNATGFGIDDTIDPADTRFWVASLLRSIRPPAPRVGKKRAALDGRMEALSTINTGTLFSASNSNE